MIRQVSTRRRPEHLGQHHTGAADRAAPHQSQRAGDDPAGCGALLQYAGVSEKRAIGAGWSSSPNTVLVRCMSSRLRDEGRQRCEVDVCRHQATREHPHRRLRERGLHVIAAALSRAPDQRPEGAGRRQIGGEIVVHRDRGRIARRRHRALGDRQAAGHLADRLIAAARRPRPFGAVAADRNVDDAGSDRSQILRRKAAARERTGAPRLDEDVGAAGQVAQLRHILDLVQVDVGGTLAKPGVHHDRHAFLFERWSDMQDLSAMLGQHPSGGGSGDHMRRIEHTDSAGGPGRRAEGLGRAVADLLDLNSRTLGQPAPLRMSGPFGRCAGDDRRQFALGQRLLELVRLPAQHGLGHRLGGVLAAQEADQVGGDVQAPSVAQQVDLPAVGGLEEIERAGEAAD
jgi:hypothetical protein